MPESIAKFVEQIPSTKEIESRLSEIFHERRLLKELQKLAVKREQAQQKIGAVK